MSVELIEVKSEWEQFVSKCNGVYIYGGGVKTKTILQQIDNNVIKGIFVSSMQNNPTEINGIPVSEIKQYKGDKNIGILIGTEKDNEKIIDELILQGFSNIAIADCIWSFRSKTVEFYHHRRKNFVEITTKMGCAVNCTYCPQKALVQRYKEISKTKEIMMSLETFKTCLHKIPKENALISFAGFTEPFGNPQAVDMILYASQQGYEVDLFTTLQGLSIKDFYKIAEIPFSFVDIHIPDKEKHAYIPKTKEYMELLKIVLDYKCKNGKPFVSCGSSQGCPDEEIMKLIDGRIKISSALNDRGGNLENECLSTKHGNLGHTYCTRSYNLSGSILLPDGSLALCCSDFGLKHIIGNLKEKTFEEIMQDKPILKIKEMMKNIKEEDDILCKNCVHAKPVTKYSKYQLLCNKK